MDNIYIISINEKRTKHMKTQMEKHNITNYCIWNKYKKGTNYDLKYLVNQMLDYGLWVVRTGGYKKLNRYKCSLSSTLNHYSCLIDAEEKGYQRILICEDDIDFVNNPNTIPIGKNKIDYLYYLECDETKSYEITHKIFGLQSYIINDIDYVIEYARNNLIVGHFDELIGRSFKVIDKSFIHNYVSLNDKLSSFSDLQEKAYIEKKISKLYK